MGYLESRKQLRLGGQQLLLEWHFRPEAPQPPLRFPSHFPLSPSTTSPNFSPELGFVTNSRFKPEHEARSKHCGLEWTRWKSKIP